jgi:hypothetical protein
MTDAGVNYGSEIGQHFFLPWLRRGIGIKVSRADGDPTTAPRATLDVGVTIGGGPLSAGGAVDVPLSLYGPGDIAALDPRVVIRTWPRSDVFQGEANYFPLIEVQPADLPWRFTPARANAQDRLRPWIALIVLRDDEIGALAAPSADQPYVTVTVKDTSTLPLPDQLWAWAHVQVTGEQSIDPAGALNLLDNDPSRILARLLCPRRLDPNTVYTGFLVPALERARLAGLKQPVPNAVDGMTPAWTTSDQNLQLPVYYSWRFQTGGLGDFASLVRRIQGRPMPATVGSRPMDETDPGLGLPAASSTPLNAEAALCAVDSASTNWTTAEKNVWVTAIQSVVNRPAELLSAPGGTPAVAPPLYGQWYAARSTLDVPSNPNGWFSDLNSDPRMRVGSGLGTLVIQDRQQQYLAGAWAQVGKIREANAALRAAQLARESARQLYQRDLAARVDPAIIAYTAPVHSRIMTSPRTVASVLKASPLAAGVLRPAWRRLVRPRGPLGRRLTKAGQAAGPTVLERINAGTLRVTPPPATPKSLSTFQRVGQSLTPSWMTPTVGSAAASVTHLSWLVLLVILLVAVLLFLVGAAALAIALVVAVGALQVSGNAIVNSAPVQDLTRRFALRNGTLTGEQITNAPKRPAFTPAEFTGTAPAQPSLAVGATELAAATRFRTAVSAVFDAFQAPIAAGPLLESADLAMLRGKIVTALSPDITIPATFQKRLKISGSLTWKFPDPLEPILAAPTFDDAMYKPLYALSRDWILAGIDQVPQDTVSLVQTNERFVESYMVGVNHEMARTLLFNGYPTDQRGTYFRQFWNSSATPPPPGERIDPNTQKDITPIDNWCAASKLGSHGSRPAPSAGNYLVLLLRSELLRRYPNMVVYATRAKWNKDGKTHDLDDTIESQPIFSGQLGSGVGFWGFDLTVSQVKGGAKPPDDPGWFFILQEPPSEPRCGLEPATTYAVPVSTWRDLSWGHLASNAAVLDSIVCIDLNSALPNTSTVADAQQASWHADSGIGRTGARASDLAYITYRVPVRVAVHAKSMIPAGAVGS